jgi:hypothetical protein
MASPCGPELNRSSSQVATRGARDSLCRHTNIGLGAAAALRGRLAAAGRHQLLLLESLQCQVEAADDDAPAAAGLDLLRDRDAVGIFTELDQGEQHHQLEPAEKLTGHILNNND